jgi:hypothetical protein
MDTGLREKTRQNKKPEARFCFRQNRVLIEPLAMRCEATILAG